MICDNRARHPTTAVRLGIWPTETPPLGDERRPQLIVSQARLAAARQAFADRHHRAPDVTENAELVRRLVDEKMLLQHALDLGLVDQEPVMRRVEQIAAFVGETPDRALELEMHREDLVIRRILVDSAQRLIRAAVLAREPSEEALASFLADHSDRFLEPERFQLTVGGAGGEKSLPLLARRDVERRYGRDLVAAIETGRLGEWQGPYPSHYGPRRVRLDTHLPERPAALHTVREAVRTAFLNDLADRWLAERTDELRRGMEVTVTDASLATVEAVGSSAVGGAS